ncbi:MAG TPA: ATP-binding protein [Candidatus Dormibacteraeota bacterium]|nr:ATP-binding protein [Candidatus Dormibacteraeota bacterium]
MSQALAALQWAVAGSLVLLGALTVRDWLRHRDRSRGSLALAVGLLGIIGLAGRLTQLSGTARVVLTVVSIALLMASAYAFLLFRHSLIPVGRWKLWIASLVVAGITAAGIAVNLDSAVSKPTGPALAVDIALLLSWCLVVGASIQRLWRVSGSLPAVQRARLRSLNAGFAGLVIALLATAVAAVGSQNLSAEVAIECVVLLSMPLLAASLSPPGWLRRIWREREEIQLRLAINNLLLYSPDEVTLAERALEWAARLLGGGGALLALDGRILAVSGISAAAGDALHGELEGRRDKASLAFTSSMGAAAVVALHTEAGNGYLAVLGGPFTPLFGDEELARLQQYAVSITVAMDRVHLVVGVRRNAELLDLAYDAVLSWDYATRSIQYWNKGASELYGYGTAEVMTRDPQDLLRTRAAIGLDAILAALLENDHWEGELEQSTKDGRSLPISARWAMQRDDEGEPLSVLEINRDISSEKRAAEELRRARDAAEQASNAKSEYLSRMSHELRTPLAAMLGFSDLLEMREPRDDQLAAIEAIQRAGSHLLSLVNDVLDIARIEAGRESLSLQPVDVRALLEECVGLVSQTANERSVRISMRLDGTGQIHVRADRQRLIQVLLNLLSNAIKYGSEGGHVVVGAAVRGDDVEIEVTDDGPGLSEDELGRLFQPFERLGAERSHVQGTGLGLALSRQLAVAMGGAVEARSVEGKGATFTVRLRRATATESASVIPARGPPVLRDAGAQHTVLYVEDNLATVALVESIFALRPSVRLMTAMQGGLAIELAREHQPDLIILDLHLPDLNGDEVMARLRQDARSAAIPVVIYSADATERQLTRLRDAGAVDYLTKPAKVSDFLEMVDSALGRPVVVRSQA